MLGMRRLAYMNILERVEEMPKPTPINIINIDRWTTAQHNDTPTYSRKRRKRTMRKNRK